MIALDDVVEVLAVKVGHQQFPFNRGAFQIFGIGHESPFGIFLRVGIAKEEQVATLGHVLGEDASLVFHRPEPVVVTIINHDHLLGRQLELAENVVPLEL